jgi:hypothetical protein
MTSGVETTAHLHARCSPDRLFAHVSHLDRYPVWMGLVHRAEPVEPSGERPAWLVELRTRVGVLARSKRLRMVRTEHRAGRLAVFEREELDGKRHSPWVLSVEVEPTDDGSRLSMHLSYGGSLWTGGVLQRVLDEEIRRGSDALLELVSSEPTR